jgi:hypothetical protein
MWTVRFGSSVWGCARERDVFSVGGLEVLARVSGCGLLPGLAHPSSDLSVPESFPEHLVCCAPALLYVVHMKAFELVLRPYPRMQYRSPKMKHL